MNGRQLPSIHSFGATPSPGAAPASGGGSQPSASAARSPSAAAASPPYTAGGLAPGSARGPGGQHAGSHGTSTSPYAQHASLKSPSVVPATVPYSVSGTTPTPPIIPPPAAAKSPATSPNPPRPSPAPSHPHHQSPPPPPPTQANQQAPSRGNPMSVSSMLSGPSRERPVAAYSPPATSSAGTAGGVAPTPVVSSVPAPTASATPQPPVMPPAHSPFASKPATANSTSAITSTAPPAPSSSSAAGPAAPAPVERSSYPPLPSAFARESPYAPAPSVSPIITPIATTAPPAAAAKAAQQSSFPSSPSTWGSASAALAHAQAQAQQAKESLFPGASVGGAAAPGGQRVGSGPQSAPRRAGPGASAPLGGSQNGHAAAGSTAGSGSGSGSGSFAWQAQAAQQAQHVQREREHRERERERELQYGQQGAQVGPGTSGLRGQTAPTTNRFPGAQDSYGTSRGQASPANGHAATAPAAAGHKRQRSELGPIGANGGAIDQTVLPSPQTVSAAAQAETIPATPPPPAAPALPLFSYSDQRKASVRPPMIEVVNDAVDAWERQHLAEVAGEKAARPERSCLGRVVYDALVPPAKLLDGEVLAQGVGGYVEVIVPTTWIIGPTSDPASAAAAASEIHSSGSVPPLDLPPVAFSVGPPSAYTGAPLPQTSPSTPLSLPTHLADLPGFRKRQVWGTDVYTDDSDILALLVHSGWLRVTRRERKRRAGERGAAADAIRRARVVGEERIETVQSVPSTTRAEEDAAREATPASARAIKVTLGVVPPLIRYQGIERQGIRSRSWGNGHDGVSLRVEKVELLADMPRIRPLRSRKARTASCAKQLAALEETELTTALAHNQARALLALESLASLRPPKRFRLGESADHGELVVTDTFVVPLGGGEGHFVEDVPLPVEDEERMSEIEDAPAPVAMEVE